MAKVIYEYLTEKVEVILIQGQEQQNDVVTRGGRNSEEFIFKKVQVKFEEALGTVKATANALKNVLDEVNPDEVSVEINLKTEAEAGFFTLCKASTGAELKITLTWKNE